MAALWEEYDQTVSLTAVAAESSQEIFHNEVDDHIFASAPITIVDGIVTIITDTDDLCRVKLCIAHELMSAADIQALDAHDSLWWYRWSCARGPLVFRIRSKKTIHPEHKLHIYMQKLRGANPTNVHIAEQLLMVRHQ